MKTVIELKANVDNGEIDKRLRYFFKNKGYGIRWKDGACLITKTGIRGRRCFKVLCDGKDYRIVLLYILNLIMVHISTGTSKKMGTMNYIS